MTDDQRKQFAIHELTAVLRSLEELDFPCTLIGGQAVYCWAGLYQTHDAAIQQFAQLTPFLSKDIDFQGGVQAVKDLAKKLNTRAERPGFREAFGNLLVGKLRILIGGAPLPIEILRKIPGFEVSNLSRYVVREEVGGIVVQLLDPVGMLQAKAWNVVNIHKEGRRDTEQFFIMVACVRAYLRMLLQMVRAGQLPMRGFLSTMERVLVFTEGLAGGKTAAACGIRWEFILPWPELESAIEPELVALREKRLPRWRAKTARHKPTTPAHPLHLKMLAILAETAQPAASPRPSPLVPRSSR